MENGRKKPTQNFVLGKIQENLFVCFLAYIPYMLLVQVLPVLRVQVRITTREFFF